MPGSAATVEASKFHLNALCAVTAKLAACSATSALVAASAALAAAAAALLAAFVAYGRWRLTAHRESSRGSVFQPGR